MIHSQLNPPKHKYTPEGSMYLNTYQEGLDENGRLVLTKTGITNIYEQIQVDAESVKIENILHAVAMGDLSALQQREASYVDATTMPKSLREAQEIIIKAKDEFYKMPLEVRKEFDNSPEQYVSEMGTPEFLEKMAPYNDKIKAISKEKSDKEYRKKVQEGAKLQLDIEREKVAMTGGEKSE